MLRIIGGKNCSRCTVTKIILDQKKIEYSYDLIEELSENEVNEVMGKAREINQVSLPLIFKDNKLIKLEEV